MKELIVGREYECYVNGRVLVVRILSIVPFGLGSVKITYVNAKKPSRKMERYSPHDFREISK